MSDIDAKLYENQHFGFADPRNKYGPVGPLRKRFWLTPFSVLDTKVGDWQPRKRAWLALGIKSEEGRDAYSYEQTSLNNLTARAKAQTKHAAYGAKGASDHLLKLEHGPEASTFSTGTSIFDPVLCEAAYRWWAQPGGTVLDPFAGGSVRGVVASLLGFRYRGIELRPVQVEANKAQLTDNNTGPTPPQWTCGDSFEVLNKVPPGWADFLFTCPPYGNLEVYSDHPADVSNMDYEGFLNRYACIMVKAAHKLADNRFACVVVSNFRDRKTGYMMDLVGDTNRIMAGAGLHLYNDIVLLNAIGTAPMRANTNFVRGHRKVVKGHQNVLVYCKGDPAKAAEKIPASDGKEA